MNNLSTEELRAIVDGVPKGATHVAQGFRAYLKQESMHDWFYWNALLQDWIEVTVIPEFDGVQSIDSLREIIALREKNSELHVAYEAANARIAELEAETSDLLNLFADMAGAECAGITPEEVKKALKQRDLEQQIKALEWVYQSVYLGEQSTLDVLGRINVIRKQLKQLKDQANAQP